VPTKQEIVEALALPADQAVAIPDEPIIATKSESTWSNSRIHSTVYQQQVVQPHLDKIEASIPDMTRAQPAPAPIAPPPGAETFRIYEPKNPRAGGSFQRRADGKLPFSGEVHDSFRGHTSDATRAHYGAWGTFTSMIAANCTGFFQWSDKYLHHRFRPLLFKEIRRLLRARESDDRLTAKEWRELVMLATAFVWYNPSFFPPQQIRAEAKALGFMAAVDGSEDDQVTVKVYQFPLHTKLLQPIHDGAASGTAPGGAG